MRRHLGQEASATESWRSARPIVDEAVGPRRVEAMHQSRKVWRSIPPILAAEPRSIPSWIAASDNSLLAS